MALYFIFTYEISSAIICINLIISKSIEYGKDHYLFFLSYHLFTKIWRTTFLFLLQKVAFMKYGELRMLNMMMMFFSYTNTFLYQIYIYFA